MEWEIVPRAQVQGVALVVIEEGKTVTKGKIGEAAVDVAEGEGKLIRIGLSKPGRDCGCGGSERELPAVDARALNGYGEKQVGVVENYYGRRNFRARVRKIASVERSIREKE